MEYRNLGKSGLKISAVSFGNYYTFGHNVDIKLAKRLMCLAYDSGINFFDTAEVYALGKAEEIMGQCLFSLNWPRDTYIIGSKVFWGGKEKIQSGLHRKHVIEGCHASLKRLKLEYLDFLLCHRYDVGVDLEETVLAMNQLIQQGKILYWGTSEWNIYQI